MVSQESEKYVSDVFKLRDRSCKAISNFNTPKTLQGSHPFC